jgi:peptidoglycan/xylan/chitin deacetylase (PgdA/CDA1 family)
MIARLIKLAVSACIYLASETWRMLRRLFGLENPGLGVFLYYHHVSSHHRHKFARQMEHLRRWTHPIPADFDGVLPPIKHSAAVTFDDGYLSVLEDAAPELERLRIPATAFVVPDFMDERLKDDPSERCETADEVKALASSRLITIGSHTATHTRMTTVDRSRGQSELLGSRKSLEQIMGRDVDTFCFPFGAYDEESLEWCSQAGYRRAFTCDPQLAFFERA